MSETKMRLEDWLDDLCVRFIINLPQEDLSSVARICFQVEEAQWFYEDFIRPLDPSLPSMSLRSFCLRIFQHCPLLSAFSRDNHMQAFEEFLLYKTRVPVRGAILLNEAMDSVVLVKGWKKGANWSFPRGKINKDEDDLDCAIREVFEETGYDIKAAGLVPRDEDVKYIEITMREQHMRLYVFRNIPMTTHFEPRTRKEISKIEWYRLSDLPAFRKKGQPGNETHETTVNANKFYMVAPFLVPLKKWVAQQRKKDAQRLANTHYLNPQSVEDAHTEEEAAFPIEAYNGSAVSQTPGIDTMEGATAALHRLLKIQPPTQGLQPEAVNATQASGQKNSGEALLALLRGKNNRESIPGSFQQVPPPQTPLDLTITNAPIPKTPHHHHPRPPQFSTLAPPPNFPLPHPNEYSQNFPPQAPPYQPTSQRIPPLALLQSFHSSQPTESVPLHVQSQQLQHPQPLPPHVQMGIFTSGQVHVPMVPPSVNQLSLSGSAHAVSSDPPNPQFPTIHEPIVSSANNKPVTTHLTSHSLALLNAFKSRDKVQGGGDMQSDSPLRRFAEETVVPSSAPQELSSVQLERTGRSSKQVSTAQPLPANETSTTDEHRSTLLNLFKSPGVKTAIQATSSRDIGRVSTTATSESISQTESPISFEVSYLTPSHSGTSTTAKQETNESPEALLKPSSHTASPFKPTAILTRPQHQKPPQSQPIKTANVASGNFSHGIKPRNQFLGENSSEITLQDPPQPPPTYASKSFHPQIMKRPTQVNPLVPVELAASGPMSRSASLQQSTQEIQSHDHKQTLLSLFGKGPSATLTSPFDQTKFPQTPERPTANAPPRSRVGSLVSATSERRGSQTPISPADKGFLLGYLDAVTRSGGQ